MPVNPTVSEVVLEWVPRCQYYLLKAKNGLTLQEIPPSVEPFRLLNCLGMLLAFPHRSTEKPQRYRITIEHVGEA
jgi:hypothetical protein